MKQVIFIMLGILIFSMVLTGIIGYKINSEVESYQKHVGGYVVFNNDTLMITDYSRIEENFTLEDGREVNYRLIDKISID